MSGVWRTDQEREIRLAESGIGAREPTTVMKVFRDTVQRRGDAKAMIFKKDDEWASYTWKEYYDKAMQFAKALIHVGVQPHQCLNIIGNNTPEWCICAVGAIAAGAISGGLYSSYSIEACRYTSQHCDAVLAVVEEREQLDIYLELVRDGSLPSLKALVMWKDPVPTDIESAIPIYSLDDFFSVGEDITDETLEERIVAQKPEDCCVLGYSSGTTGAPKALMLSQDNVTWTSYFLQCENGTDENERLISYIPIPQVAAIVMEVHYPMLLGCEIYFIGPDGFDAEKLVDFMRIVRPTIYLSIAKIWEDIMKGVQLELNKLEGFQQSLTNWALKHGTDHFNRSMYGEDRRASLRFRLARQLVLKSIKESIGLDQAKVCLAVGMPIADDIVRFFGSIDLPVYGGYGQSEGSGPQTSNRVMNWKLGSVGVSVPGIETKIDEATGEVLCAGRHIFMGYLSDEAATKEKLRDGWMHSGDIGRFDEDGFLYITGRIKELIIIANSEHVAPGPIEDALKAELPALAHAVVVGEGHENLTFFCTLQASSTGELDEVALGVAKTIGSSATTAKDAAGCPKFQAYVQAGMERVNAVAKNDDHVLAGFTILPQTFSIETGELTSWYKVKRGEIASKYAQEIDNMYAKLNAGNVVESA